MGEEDNDGAASSGVPAFDRRTFFRTMGAGAATIAAARTIGLSPLEAAPAAAATTTTTDRRQLAFQCRVDAAQMAHDRPVPVNAGNGEDHDYPLIATYSKGLPHDGLGIVVPAAHTALMAALTSGDPAQFEAVPLGGARTLTNPQAGKAFDLQGPDCHALAMRPAPRIDGPENAAEMAELYWMALLRDVSFTHFGNDAGVAAAAQDLSTFSDFRAPKQRGKVTAKTVFRGNTRGDRTGPFVSQFLLKDIPYGSLLISQRQETVMPGSDFLTTYDEWLNVQNGAPRNSLPLDSARRYIRNMRDLAHYVHVDALYEAYLNACLILLAMNAPLDAGNPYIGSRNQHGFGTFGGPHILSLVTEVATRALKAVWFQKWYVHRRMRPEEFGGRVHNQLRGAATYPINQQLLHSAAVQTTAKKQGTHLLSTAFPEGAPTHPSYGSGHATVAGACVTILKAWFDENFVIPSPVVANRDGTELFPYGGSDAGQMTVGGELNKVAANIAGARNMAGIHWRSDYWEGVRLGEQVAVGVLEEQKATYNETHSFTFTSFDGASVTI